MDELKVHIPDKTKHFGLADEFGQVPLKTFLLDHRFAQTLCLFIFGLTG